MIVPGLALPPRTTHSCAARSTLGVTMILVVGATGLLGAEICGQLRTAGEPVRGLVRLGSPRAQLLRDHGVEVITGDLRNRSDVELACRGVRAVISTATAMGSKDKRLTLRDIDLVAQLQLVEVTKRAGVEHFVYVSASPMLQPAAPLIGYKREVERAVRASGMRWTILQPSVFMEVWLSSILGWDIAAGKARVFGSGDAPMSWISVADVAAYAVRSLRDLRLVDQVLPLGGPDAVSPNDVVKMFTELSGRPFTAAHVPLAVLRFLGPVIGLFNEGAASGMSMGAQTAGGDVIESPLQREIGLPLTSLRDYAARVLKV